MAGHLGPQHRLGHSLEWTLGILLFFIFIPGFVSLTSLSHHSICPQNIHIHSFGCLSGHTGELRVPEALSTSPGCPPTFWNLSWPSGSKIPPHPIYPSPRSGCSARSLAKREPRGRGSAAPPNPFCAQGVHSLLEGTSKQGPEQRPR